jgi:nitroimidazol reductase NimA-like FMN-containing flavoprotein (pyridoxamine 5'-phosphate oxidase superfamily)
MEADMAGSQPVAELMEFSRQWTRPEQFRSEDVTPTPWAQARSGLERAGTYWLATVHPDGRPHVVPVLAVVVDGVVHFCASDRSRKARNIAADPRCAITASSDTLDLVVEGQAMAVSDEAAVRRVAEAYAVKYGWRPEVREGALWADGAPTAGPPPYRVHRVVPATAFGFPTDEESVPTRWRF